MRKIFTGFIFVFLDFHLNIGASQIGFIPDFVGYILIIKGLDELLTLSGNFAKARPLALGMATYTGILYAFALFGMRSAFGGIPSFVLGLVSAIISLYISYLVVMGIKDIESTQDRLLQSGPLYTAWKGVAIVTVIIYFAVLIPVLAILCLIAGFIINIYFLVSLNRSKNLYYQNQ